MEQRSKVLEPSLYHGTNHSLELFFSVPAKYVVLSIADKSLASAYALSNPSLSVNVFDGFIVCCAFFLVKQKMNHSQYLFI